MKRIIRFEKDGVGMYSMSATALRYMNEGVHCGPEEDEKLWMGLDNHKTDNGASCLTQTYMQNFFFGFISKRQARRWVYRKRWLKALAGEGIKVSEYFCLDEDVVVGKTQAVFCEHHHKVVYEIPEYFKLK